MDLQYAIKNRRSIRNFTDEPITKEVVNKIIEAAIYAPSACNQQGWKFIVIDSDQVKNRIYEKHYSRLVKAATVGIIVLYRNDVSFNYLMYKDHIQSGAAAIQNMLLTAYENGVGACWVCDLPPQRVMRKLLNIPKCYDIIALVALGYEKNYLSEHTLEHYDMDVEKANKRVRKDKLENMISYNIFSGKREKVNNCMFFRAFLFGVFKSTKSKFIKRILVNIIKCRKDIIK